MHLIFSHDLQYTYCCIECSLRHSLLFPTMTEIQIYNNPYREWLDTSIRERSINCYSENDLTLNPTPIGRGGYAVVYKATEKNSGISVAVKTFVATPNSH